MTLIDTRLVPLGRSQSLPNDASVVRLRRGVGLRTGPADQEAPPWQTREMIARARLFAVAGTLSGSVVFALYSALAIWGIVGWIDNPDVTFRYPSRYTGTGLRTVEIGRTAVPAVRARQIRATALAPHIMRLGDIFVDGLETTALLFATSRHPLEAFVAISAILRKMTGVADKFVLRRERDLAESARLKLLAALDDAHDLRGIRTARRILIHADARCESPGEAALLWLVLSVCPVMPETQYEVVAGGRIRFIDIAFPGLKIALEFDGVGKTGRDQAAFSKYKRDQMERDNALINAGWRVYHFGWGDFHDFAALRDWLVRQLHWHGAAVPADRRALYRPVPLELTSWSRRLGMPTGATTRRGEDPLSV